MNKKPSAIISFFRYNIIAVLATAIDFGVLIFFTEILQLWYLFSAFWGAFAGGVTAFILGRNWAFMQQEKKLATQAKKYVFVWVGSIFLNVYGLYLVVEYLGYQYIVSKIIVALIVGIGFNFLMQKYFIFK